MNNLREGVGASQVLVVACNAAQEGRQNRVTQRRQGREGGPPPESGLKGYQRHAADPKSLRLFVLVMPNVSVLFRTMNPLDIIRKELRNHPELKVDDRPRPLTVFPNDDAGFLVKFVERKRIYIVLFDRWGQGFVKNQEGVTAAVNLFMFGLSNSCRMKTYRKGGVDYRWDIEYRNDDRWLKGLSSTLLIYPFWKEDQTRYRQNKNQFVGDVTISFLEFRSERTRAHVVVLFFVALAVLVYCLNRKFGFDVLFAYSVFLFPFIVLAVFFPLLGIHIWFDDRRLLIRRRTQHRKGWLYFIMGWCVVWIMALALVWQVFGSKTVLGAAMFLWPFLLCAFFIPVLVFYGRATKGGER
jgi:hypothetical protein